MAKLASGSGLAVKLTSLFSVTPDDFVGANDSYRIDSALSYLVARGGGALNCTRSTGYTLPWKITVTDANLFIQGGGGDKSHDVGGQAAQAMTKWTWAGAPSGTMLEFASPAGATFQKKQGGGVRGIYFNANSGAGVGLSIQSWYGGFFSDLYFEEFLTSCVDMNVVATLGEARDPQRNLLQRFGFRQFNQTGAALTLDGDATANTSFNRFVDFDIAFKNGDAVAMKNCDNNDLTGFRVQRAVGGVGNSVVFYGSDDAVGRVARANRLWGFSSNVAPVAKGTTSYTFPSHDNWLWNDPDNSTPAPTVETGATCFFADDKFFWTTPAFTKVGIGDTRAQAIAMRDAITSDSVRIYNGSSNHARFYDSTNAWGLNIDGSTGRLRFNHISGATNEVEMAATLQINGAGEGLNVKEGVNCRQGVTAAMTTGAVTVANTRITASSRILYSRETAGGTLGDVSLTKSAGVSFTLTSTSATETSTFAYQIFEPAT